MENKIKLILASSSKPRQDIFKNIDIPTEPIVEMPTVEPVKTNLETLDFDIPTGIVVACQDERSQLKNREKAMKVLRSKIHKLEMEKQATEISNARKSQIGSGDRSERIRTYNYPQGRVSDHRISLTLHYLKMQKLILLVI